MRVLVPLVLVIAFAGLAPAPTKALAEEQPGPWVLKVNGEAVSLRLFERRMMRNRAAAYRHFRQEYGAVDSADFWTTSHGGEAPIEWIKSRALEECVRIKVEQILAREKGVVGDIGYASFLDSLAEENERRKRALAAGEPIYGPMEYGEDTYFSYVFSNMVIELKRRLGRGELQATEEALRARYEETKEKLYKRGPRVKVGAIKASFRGGDAQGGLSKEEAKARLAEMKGRLDEGGLFEELARVYDDDGMLREWTFDDRSARFDWQWRPRAREEAMKLSEGEIGEVFEERNALYVLKCIEREKAGYLPFEDVEQNVRSKYVDERYEELVRGSVAGAEVEINRSVYEAIRVR